VGSNAALTTALKKFSVLPETNHATSASRWYSEPDMRARCA